jgi:tetratricopeptide (TPR) repeat protein
MIRVSFRIYYSMRQSAALCLVAAAITGCASSAPISENENQYPAGDGELPVQEQLAEPVPLAPTSTDVMFNVFAAEHLGSEGDLKNAVGYYLEAAMESNDSEIARRATRIAIAAQAWQQAAMAAVRWALLDPDSVQAHENAAATLLLTGDYSGAELHVERIIILRGNSTEAWVKVSSLLAQSANPEKASRVLENVLARQGDVNNASAMYAQSQLAVRERNLEKAYELAQKAAELEPERSEFLTWAGRLALNLNKTGAGLEYIERAWRMSPDDHDLALAYADLLARTGQADGARRVMEEMPQTPDVMLSRILFELSDGKTEAAESLFSEFSNMKFEDPQEHTYYEAQAAQALGKIQLAIELYGLIKSGERALVSGIRRAELMAQEGEVEAARQELAYMRLQGSEVFAEESWLAEARILRDLGEREEALKVLDLALDQFPGSVAIRYSHALLAAELGWVDLAENDLRIIISEQPENAAALNALGYTLADQTERFEEAEALIRQAYILQPEEAAIVDSMGWIAYRRGRLAEAEQFLRRAWDLEKNPEIGAHLGEVLWMMGRKEAARSIWLDSMKLDVENPVLKETLQRLDTSN